MVRLPFGYGSESEMCNECKWNCRLAAALNVPRGIFIGVSLFCLVVFFGFIQLKAVNEAKNDLSIDWYSRN